MLMVMMLSNGAAAQSRFNSVTQSPKLVDKTLKLRLKVLKGEILLTGDEIGATEVAEGSRKRSGEPGQAVVQNKKKKLELKKDGCSADASSAANAATVAVDLSYEDLMNDKESASLATQVINLFHRHHLVPQLPQPTDAKRILLCRSLALTRTTSDAQPHSEWQSPRLRMAKLSHVSAKYPVRKAVALIFCLVVILWH
jgi:hypothetical protein